jgi:hypothetical protein
MSDDHHHGDSDSPLVSTLIFSNVCEHEFKNETNHKSLDLVAPHRLSIANNNKLSSKIDCVFCVEKKLQPILRVGKVPKKDKLAEENQTINFEI